MNQNKLMLTLVIGFVGILFLGFMATKVIPKMFVTWTKAAPATKVSLADSYLIGGKILAKSDGVDKCVVNVFVLDGNGKGVKGTQVSLSGMSEGDMEVLSGNDGKATFEISSVQAGQFTLSASIGGSPLSKTVKVTFRE